MVEYITIEGLKSTLQNFKVNMESQMEKKIGTSSDGLNKSILSISETVEAAKSSIEAAINTTQSGIGEQIDKVQPGIEEKINKLQAALMEPIGKIEKNLPTAADTSGILDGMFEEKSQLSSELNPLG